MKSTRSLETRATRKSGITGVSYKEVDSDVEDDVYQPRKRNPSESKKRKLSSGQDDDYDHKTNDGADLLDGTVITSKSVLIKRNIQVSSSRPDTKYLFDMLRSTRKISVEVDRWITLRKCSGAPKGYIENNMDIENIDSEEYEKLLLGFVKTMASASNIKYPLQSSTKEYKLFRPRYLQFWDNLAEKLATPSSSTAGKDGANILTSILDLLIMTSSIAVSSVREAVVEATLTIGKRVLLAMEDVTKDIEITTRQLMTQKSGATGGLTKQQALNKQKQLSEEILTSLKDLTVAVFNSIFVHRYKDASEAIRASCVRHLADWLCTAPSDFFNDGYLKYLGWMLSDRSVVVRRETVRSLCRITQDETHAPKLAYFVERFADRFIEVAAGDVDDLVSLDMLTALRRMQQVGLLDDLEQSMLDLVDEIVFDPRASLRCRQEALAFVMDHTEGFDSMPQDMPSSTTTAAAAGSTPLSDDMADEEEAEGGGKGKRRKKERTSTSSKRKSTGSIPGKGDTSVAALAARQRTAKQLETLAEFVHHHLITRRQGQGHVEKAEAEWEEVEVDELVSTGMVVEACLALPQGVIMRDWSTMTSLLLREGDGLVSCSLDPTQASILLRILVASAMQLHTDNDDTSDGKSLITENRSSKTRKVSPIKSFTNTQNSSHWNALGIILCHDLPRLLVRYRDDPRNLSELSRLLVCECLATSLEQMKGNVVKGFLKVINELFVMNTNIDILSRLVAGLRLWSDRQGSNRSSGLVEQSKEVLEKLVKSDWLQSESLIAKVKQLDWTVWEADGGVGGDAANETNIWNEEKKTYSSKVRGGTVSGGRAVKSPLMTVSASAPTSLLPTLNEAMSSLCVALEHDDAVRALFNSIQRSWSIWNLVDCRPFFTVTSENDSQRQSQSKLQKGSSGIKSRKRSPEEDEPSSPFRLLEEMAENWVEVSEITLTISEIIMTKRGGSSGTGTGGDAARGVDGGSGFSINESDCFRCALCSVKLLFLMVLWASNEVFSSAKTLMMAVKDDEMEDEKEDIGGGDIIAVSSEMAEDWEDRHYPITSMVLRVRDYLVDVLVTWMTMRPPEEIAGDVVVQQRYRYLSRTAFGMIGDLRSLFPPRLADYAVSRALVWPLSQHVVAGMRRVFEEEGTRIQLALASLSDEELQEESALLLSYQLTDDLLTPLAQPLLFDIQNLNRTQASAVMLHWMDNSPVVQDLVKHFAKKLRETNFAKFLEVQMVALKGSYADRVVGPLRRATNQSSEEELDDIQNISDAGLEAVVALSKKLSMSIGVGKLAGIAAGTLMNFFRTGLDYSVSNPSTLRFLEVVSGYVRFLNASFCAQLSEILEEKLGCASEEVRELLGRDEASSAVVDVFRATLKSGGTGAGAAAAAATRRRGESAAGGRVSSVTTVSRGSTATAASTTTAVSRNREVSLSSVEEGPLIKPKSSGLPHGRGRDRATALTPPVIMSAPLVATTTATTTATATATVQVRKDTNVHLSRPTKKKRSRHQLSLTSVDEVDEVEDEVRDEEDEYDTQPIRQHAQDDDHESKDLDQLNGEGGAPSIRPSKASILGPAFGLHLEDLEEEVEEEEAQEVDYQSEPEKLEYSNENLDLYTQSSFESYRMVSSPAKRMKTSDRDQETERERTPEPAKYKAASVSRGLGKEKITGSSSGGNEDEDDGDGFPRLGIKQDRKKGMSVTAAAAASARSTHARGTMETETVAEEEDLFADLDNRPSRRRFR